MRRSLHAGLELDDDRARIDIGAVHDYLSNESYWARGCSLQDVENTIGGAARVVGLYDAGRQVGFARVISDGVHVSYLCDVYVLAAYRGRGFGVELVREAVRTDPRQSSSGRSPRGTRTASISGSGLRRPISDSCSVEADPEGTAAGGVESDACR